MKKAVVVVIVLLATLLLALPALAQGGVTVNTGFNLALRACADRNSESFATVPFDTTLGATALSTDRNWVAVNYNGQPGWLTLEFTSVESGRLGDLPISGQCFQRGGGGGGVTSPVNVRMNINLRYRTEPTLDVRPVGAIPYLAEVPALGLSSDGSFVLVNYQGQNVWVWREYVTATTGSLSQFTPGAAPIAGGAAPAPAAPAGGGTTAPATGGRSGVFVAIDGTNAAHGWNNGVPGDIRARSFATARVIAYIREAQNVVESCVYNVFINGAPSGQVTMNRIKVQYTVRLVDGISGAQLDERGFEGNDPEVCPGSVPGGRRDFYSYPNVEQALSWFRERANG